jgi:hypothetical protein
MVGTVNILNELLHFNHRDPVPTPRCSSCTAKTIASDMLVAPVRQGRGHGCTRPRDHEEQRGQRCERHACGSHHVRQERGRARASPRALCAAPPSRGSHCRAAPRRRSQRSPDTLFKASALSLIRTTSRAIRHLVRAPFESSKREQNLPTERPTGPRRSGRTAGKSVVGQWWAHKKQQPAAESIT